MGEEDAESRWEGTYEELVEETWKLWEGRERGSIGPIRSFKARRLAKREAGTASFRDLPTVVEFRNGIESVQRAVMDGSPPPIDCLML